MRKAARIGLVVLGSLIIVSGIIMLLQWNNIRAVTQSVQYSKVELADKIQSRKVEEKILLANYGVTKIRDFTFEEEEALRKGIVSASEVAVKLQEALEQDENQEEVQTQNQDQVVVQGKSPSTQEQIQAIIAKHITSIYTIKARFIGALGQLEQEARAEFKALPKEERNMLGAQKIVLSRAGQAATLESECNKEVTKVLVSLEQELTPLTDDLSIIENIYSAYEEEKVLKKAYYLSLLGE